MVCRENKGRSAMIGLAKAYQRMMGYPVDHDANLQSMQHQLRHEVEAADAKYSSFNSWPPDEQAAAWKELRARIVELPEEVMSEARRYGESHTNPGIITRIDQELARIESGKHENGRQLKAVQQNTGADMVASMKIVSMMERLVPARRNFLESQARRRGVPYTDVEQEWLSHINTKGNFSNISLKDDYRETLSVAGVSAQDQADLGQAGRAREAMAAMEAKTQAVLAKHRQANPPRPAIGEQHVRATYSKPPTGGTIRCAGCGQFGHKENDCPNEDLTSTLKAISSQYDMIARHESIHKRRAMLANTPHEDIQKVFDARGVDMTVEQFSALVDRDEHQLAEPLRSEATLQKQKRQFEKEGREALAELNSREPKISSWVSSIAYNPHNGLLQVDVHPAKSGKKYPPRYFRARPEEVDRLLSQPTIGTALHANFLHKNKVNELHEFENDTDLIEALTETRCLTCGRWASMNSNHRCPVTGGPSEELTQIELRKRMEYQAKAREARQDGKVVPAKPPTFVPSIKARTHHGGHTVDPVSKKKIAGSLRSGDKKEALAAVSAGNTVWDTPVAFNGSDDDWHVSGHVAVWQDPETGHRLIGIHGQSGRPGLRCECPEYQNRYQCPHVRAVGDRLSIKYEAAKAHRSTRAGEPLGPQLLGTANDAAAMPPERLNYHTMSEMRVAEMRKTLNAADSHGLPNLPETMWPSKTIDMATGEPIEPPTTWRRTPDKDPRKGKSQTVDLNNQQQCVIRMRKLAHNTVELPVHKPVPGGGYRTELAKKRVAFSVRAEPDGSIIYNLPPSVLSESGNIEQARAMEQFLREKTNTPDHVKIIPNGLRVPPDPASRFAALDAIAGDEPRIKRSRMYAPEGGSFDEAMSRGRSGNDGVFAPA